MCVCVCVCFFPEATTIAIATQRWKKLTEEWSLPRRHGMTIPSALLKFGLVGF